MFALTGALVAVRKRLDLFGTLVLAVATGLGGGLVRDVLIADVPPPGLIDWRFLLTASVAGVATFLWHPVVARWENIILTLDAAGLALFCVTGAVKASEAGLSVVPAALLGMITAVGGGMVRDVLANRVPVVLEAGTGWYAVPALVGADDGRHRPPLRLAHVARARPRHGRLLRVAGAVDALRLGAPAGPRPRPRLTPAARHRVVTMRTVTLNNGVEMPILGFGVYQIEPEDTERCVADALAAGYRHLDTAAGYDNEEQVGRAIASSGIARDELFVTTKLWVQGKPAEENTRKAWETSLQKLGLDHVDLYLMHQPYGDVHGQWRGMEAMLEQGAARAIGVSNFHGDRLVDLIGHNEVTPAVNQVETHPFYQRAADQELMKDKGVQIESWGPFAEGRNGLFTNALLTEIGEAHGKSVAQVVLRWLVQRDVVVIPKSVRPERMAENFDVFGFELTDERDDAHRRAGHRRERLLRPPRPGDDPDARRPPRRLILSRRCRGRPRARRR